MAGWTYILANRKHGAIYIGMTAHIQQRILQHRKGEIEGFTRRYGIERLIHYEEYATAPDAIEREKQLKNWKRAWKIRLIEERNPEWDDLWDEINTW